LPLPGWLEAACQTSSIRRIFSHSVYYCPGAVGFPYTSSLRQWKMVIYNFSFFYHVGSECTSNYVCQYCVQFVITDISKEHLASVFRVKVVTTYDTPLPHRSWNRNWYFHGSLNHKLHNWTFEPINIDKGDEDINVLDWIVTKQSCSWFSVYCMHWTIQLWRKFKYCNHSFII
jgi:hypothetical protein